MAMSYVKPKGSDKLVPCLDGVMYSIHPRHCENIAIGKKRIEIRKTKPKANYVPFKGYIYMTAGDATYPVTLNDAPYTCSNVGGKVVIGEFICNQIKEYDFIDGHYEHGGDLEKMCLSQNELDAYGQGKRLYGICITDVVMYAKPKSITDFWLLGKCPYNDNDKCIYNAHCFRAGEKKRCGERLTRPPQSWCYVENLEAGGQ